MLWIPAKVQKNHEAPKRSDYTDHLFPNLELYLKAEHPEWLPFPKEDRELLADSVLKAAWVNCRIPLVQRYNMVDGTPKEWIEAYEEPHRRLAVGAVEAAEERLSQFGYCPECEDPEEDIDDEETCAISGATYGSLHMVQRGAQGAPQVVINGSVRSSGIAR